MIFWRKLRTLFSRNRLEQEMTAEMQAHFDELAERHRAEGIAPEEARYAAMRDFGGVEQIKERCRDEWEIRWLEGLWRDLRFSCRSLRRSPVFTATVVMTLALCLGANSAVFTVLYGMVLKPLPFHDPGQIVEVYNSRPNSGQLKQRVSVAQYLDYRKQADLFERFALWDGWMFNVGEESIAERLIGMKVTPEYFALLGAPPLLGRYFTEEECAPGRDAVVVLTQDYWETHYHADPAVLNRVVRLSRRAFTIVGVAPRSVQQVTAAPMLFKPLEWTAEATTPQWRLVGMGTMYARVKPGVAPGEALAQLQTLEERFRDRVADPAARENLYQGGFRMRLGQVRAEQTQPIRNGLLLLQGGACLVLLLGCVNVASLMLARANARQVELAVRQALGASRGALARQLLVEAGLLALAGGVAGLGLAWASLRVINAYTTTIVFGSPEVTLDGQIIIVTLVVVVGVALSIGLLPVSRTWRERESCAGGLHGGARGTSRGSSIRVVSGGLVIAQVALALMLLVGAGLLVRSFAKVMATDPGFDAAKVIHVRVAVDHSYASQESIRAAQSRLIEKLRDIPGVESVAYSIFMPGYDGLKPSALPLRGMPPGKDGAYPTAVVHGVSPEFLSTMGIRLLEGRNFTAADLMPGARQVVIVDRRFAERHFPGRSAVGALFAFGPKPKSPEEATMIVGVAEAVKFVGLDDRNGTADAYVAVNLGMGGVSIELRTTRTLADMLPLIRAQVRSVDPALPIYQAQTLRMHLDDAAANRRGVMWLLGAFAGVALLLAAVGIYGMLAYDVTQRTREIGIRGAIGATRGQIIGLILRQGILKAGLGLAIGLAGAFGLSRFLESMLYEVEPWDPLVFTGAPLFLLMVAFLACWLPAWRAAKVDPIQALRSE